MLMTQHTTKLGEILHMLQITSRFYETLLKWFIDNSMKSNPGKYHLFLSANDSSKIRIGNKTISSSKCEKILVIKIDNNLNFKEHIESLCKKASKKINALSRLASSINFEQRRLIMNSFVICYFSYFPVVWMFHSRKINACINRLHKTTL